MAKLFGKRGRPNRIGRIHTRRTYASNTHGLRGLSQLPQNFAHAKDAQRKPRRDEKEEQKKKTWDLWVDCEANDWVQHGKKAGIDEKTAKKW
jgi:hypothetical protein